MSWSCLTREIVRYDFQSAASRLVGAYRFLEMDAFANDIQKDLQKLGMRITPNNPFKHEMQQNDKHK